MTEKLFATADGAAPAAAERCVTCVLPGRAGIHGCHTRRQSGTRGRAAIFRLLSKLNKL